MWFIITRYLTIQFVQRSETMLKWYEIQNAIVKNWTNSEGINYIMYFVIV